MNAAVARDWTALDLANPGRTLIEASAGTGKTWTISVLYLRLLLEQGLSPTQIVVTTFTDAAAQELRERLRGRLVWAEDQALAWPVEAPADAPTDLAWLHVRWHADPAQAGRDRLRLRLALADLDRAPVTTLHGLCKRILDDYPFESGASLQAGELVSAETLLDEWAEDLWRQLQQAAVPPPPTAPAALGELRRLLRAYLQPGVALWAPDADELARLLPAERADALEALADRADMFQPRKSALRNALRAFAGWLRDRGGELKDSTLKNLAATPWDDQLQPQVWNNAGHAELLRFVGSACRALGYALHADHVLAWQDWLAQVDAWRSERLAARGQLTFDELIARVGDALARPEGRLAARLFAEWPVALVDEFQDTDAQQYAILDAIYRGRDGAARGRLVMIGDPKQAIYRFRGGDIRAYLAAADTASEVLRLDVNQRSASGLVEATNQFYALVGEPLGRAPDTAIRYQEVRAAGRRDHAPLTIDGAPLAQPLQLHFNADLPDSAPARRRAALEACAAQIAAMLGEGRHRLGEAPLAPGDIAVLLPGNADITTLRTLLQRYRVPCVGAGRSSVFELPLARELHVLLHAVEHASDEGAVRAALATRLYGLDYATLKALRDEPDAWLVYEQQFAAWRTRWQREGVLAVVRALIERAAPRLLAGDDGERALTDLRHLGELLQAQAEAMPGPAQLLDWLARQRDGEDAGGDAAEERQLRIESDARRVRLMTLHASKGLEFPVVFLPLMWNHCRNDRDTDVVIHEPLCERRVVGFGKAAKAQYDAEGQDERFRVLYVALTRAIHACHVYALPPDRLAKANAREPQKDPERSPLDASIARLLQRQQAGEDLATLAPRLAWSTAGWPWRATPLPPAQDDAPARQARPLPAARPMAQVYSFSNLTRGAHAGALEDQAASDEAALPSAADVLEDVAPRAAPHPELLALAGVRGADIGNALHAMFELRAIGQPMEAQSGLIDRCLREFGVRLDEGTREAFIARLARRLQANLDTPLLPGLRLGALPAKRQLAEMEFHYALDDASMAALREACTALGEPALVPFASSGHLRGRMTGKIDLILEHDGRYLVLDYKSNYLGEHVEDYLPAALGPAMDAHHYRFQALLYTVALDRMLRQRLPDYTRERHLGESIYLFVRAVGLEPDAGVWRHRFDDALIEAVDNALAGRELELVA
ncbi:UvrD-helicase domain-containing protein [Frateuria hangzhouensis]|uniref:UvrD-helicase domain-containing protein n=1 Tax=Frateuria hangzhouensis TaxID=2995589 RepID=UPI002260A724|nr:UvrD-helicase domain-containing protein [Frateuria sp. STR12]MCX7512818.1 UvrD-helicase domain-containing protein [Frateuria sp. STR12]